MIQKMLLFLSFGNSLTARNPYWLHVTGNQFLFSLKEVNVLSIFVLALLLVFSIYVSRIPSGSTFLLLLLFLMALMVVSQSLVRSWYRFALICCGCTEYTRVLSALIIL